ncbi:MAG: S8 family serine peptidase, partial [Bacteroidaceae bacterium]|nr:S8 family serine peptidase [Bacteroidaceae bacterium]
VINMSLANEIGAHDGSDLAAQFMKEISQDAIYCLSAGNYGCFKEHVHHTFAQDGETAKISLYNDQYSGVQFFSDNDKPFSLKFRAAGDGIVPVTLASIREAGTLVIDSENADDPLVQKVKPYISTPNFRIEMRAGKYYNGKYFVELFATDCLIDPDFGYFQLEIAADKDTHIEGHIFMATGGFSWDKKPGEMVPDDNGSINSLVPGTNAIVVGAMAARATIPLIDGKEVDYSGCKAQAGDMAPFSSWISYPDGSSLPHIVAPGYNVVAAGNLYDNKGIEDNCVRIDEKFGRKCHYIVLSGTSMAAPFVTGVVAMWLQANPDLTATDIRAIMKKTAKTTTYMEQCSEPARWGWGVIDAYSGIKEALAMPSAITDATKVSPQFIRVVGNTLEIATAGHTEAVLYNLSGTMIATTTNGSIDISSVPHGIYLVKVSGNKAVKIRL